MSPNPENSKQDRPPLDIRHRDVPDYGEIAPPRELRWYEKLSGKQLGLALAVGAVALVAVVGHSCESDQPVSPEPEPVAQVDTLPGIPYSQVDRDISDRNIREMILTDRPPHLLLDPKRSNDTYGVRYEVTFGGCFDPITKKTENSDQSVPLLFISSKDSKNTGEVKDTGEVRVFNKPTSAHIEALDNLRNAYREHVRSEGGITYTPKPLNSDIVKQIYKYAKLSGIACRDLTSIPVSPTFTSKRTIIYSKAGPETQSGASESGGTIFSFFNNLPDIVKVPLEILAFIGLLRLGLNYVKKKF